MRVGVIGLGKMGAAIAARLMECGHDVTVWNRTDIKAKPLIDTGAKAAENPRDLASKSDIILSALTDAPAIEATLDGSNGLLSADLTGKTFIEMSTVRPASQIAFAEKVRSRGGAYVECAVSGTVGPARQGRLIGLVGAEEADLEKVRSVLKQFCRRIEHIGPVGSGASLKLAVNLPLIIYYQALGEAYTLCKHLGRETDWFIDLLSDTSGGPNILKVRGAVIAAALRGEDPSPASFEVDALRKDLRTMISEASHLGRSLPIAERALEVYDEASARGWGNRDGNALPRYWSEREKA